MTNMGEVYHIVSAEEIIDVEALRPVLESAIVSPYEDDALEVEISDVLASVEASIAGDNDRQYLIAKTPAGTALGMMGLQPIPSSSRMLAYSMTGSPAEIINAYVDSRMRGVGVGRTLLRHIEELAASQGYRELIVNSGPRYEQTGWPFWTSMYGCPVATAHHYYGPDAHANVWRTFLYPSN